MSKHKNLGERQDFDHKMYRKLALLIHARFCDAYGCTYGRETPEMHEHDQEVMRGHLEHKGGECSCWELLECRSCQASVDAENLAARVQFGKGGKVRR